jgi:hypothetical protein
MLRRPVLIVASLLGMLCLAAPAAGLTTVSPAEVARELQGDAVYVDPDAEAPLNEDAVRDAIAGAPVPVYVAAVPRVGDLNGFTSQVLDGLGERSAVLVISGRSFRAESGAEAAAQGVYADVAIESALAAGGRGSFNEENVTALVVDFVRRLEPGAAGGTGAPVRDTGSGVNLLPILGLGALGFGAYAVVSSRRKAKASRQQLEDMRADVESLYGRLGSDVQLLAPGDDAIARQALADAAERYNATGALMAKADTPGEFAAARRTAAEGLAAARVVRQRLGLDPGPEVPLPPGTGPQLDAPARVRVGDEEYEGSPRYEPGRPHYFEGGYYGSQHVPGGWYATPFWQTLLLSSVLSGGMRGHRHSSYGGGMFGGGMGGGRRGGGGSW